MFTLRRHPCQLGLKFADKSEKQGPEKWVWMSYKERQKVKKHYIGWWGGFLVVEQHVPSGGGAVENEKEVMEAHQGLERVLLPQRCRVAWG